MKKTKDVKPTKAEKKAKKAARKAEKQVKKSTKRGKKSAKLFITFIKSLKKLDDVGTKSFVSTLQGNKKINLEVKQRLQKMLTSLVVKAKKVS